MKYLVTLPDELVLTIGPRGSIALFSEKGLNEFIANHFDELGGYNPSDEEHAIFVANLYSSAANARVDNKGRITLPAPLMAQAGIVGREIVIIGQGTYLIIVDVDYRNKLTAPSVYG
jgi:DNA-binding transcriptional regulator/RsmH inhibitor MraZ